MGTDPLRSADNERLDHRGVSGAELLEAVRNGRIWLNITGKLGSSAIRQGSTSTRPWLPGELG